MLTAHSNPTAPASPAAPVRIDWRAAAHLLAEGLWPKEIAEKFGIDEQRFWRHLHQSARFRHYIRQALDRRRLVLQLHFAAGVPAALDLFRSGSGQDLSWLAEALDVGGEARHLRDRQRAAKDAGDVVERLGATGDPPRRVKPEAMPQRQPETQPEPQPEPAQEDAPAPQPITVWTDIMQRGTVQRGTVQPGTMQPAAPAPIRPSCATADPALAGGP